MSSRSASRQAPYAQPSWRVRWVPIPSQLASRGKDAFLQVVERMFAFSLVPGTGLPSFHSGRPGRGLPHEGIPGRGWPRRGAGQEFPQMAGLSHAQAGIVRA